MRAFLLLSAMAVVITGVILAQLSRTSELVAWEIFLVLLLIVLWRVFPSRHRDRVPNLFHRVKQERPIPPRSVSSFELAAVHAYSESPGADRRLKVLMRRIAGHRLTQRGVRMGSPRASELVDPVLYDEGLTPMSKTQIERVVSQLEEL